MMSNKIRIAYIFIISRFLKRMLKHHNNNTYFHIHFITASRQKVGRLYEVLFTKRQMKLHLPTA